MRRQCVDGGPRFSVVEEGEAGSVPGCLVVGGNERCGLRYAVDRVLVSISQVLALSRCAVRGWSCGLARPLALGFRKSVSSSHRGRGVVHSMWGQELPCQLTIGC